MLTEGTILTIATSGLFFQYFYYYFYEKNFKESYINFKKKFDPHLRKEFSKDLKNLKEKIKDEDFEILSNILKDKAFKLQEVSQPATKYLKIHDTIKYFYIIMFVSIVSSIFSLRLPDYLLFNKLLLDWAFYFLIFALGMFIWIFLSIHSLKKQVIKFELGYPIKELLKEKNK